MASHREDHGREIDGVWCTAKQTDMSCLSTWHEQSMRLERGKHVCMYGDFRGQWGVLSLQEQTAYHIQEMDVLKQQSM